MEDCLGPASFRTPTSLFDDVMMYVAQQWIDRQASVSAIRLIRVIRG